MGDPYKIEVVCRASRHSKSSSVKIEVRTDNCDNFLIESIQARPDIHDTSDVLKNVIIDYFAELPEVYAVLQNDFYYKVFRPTFALLTQLEALLEKYESSKLVLYGGADYAWISLFRALGEGDPLFFKDYDIHNAIVYRYFKTKCNVVWNDRQFSLLSKYRFLTREIALLSVRLSLQFVSGFRYPIKLSSRNYQYVFFCDIEHQYNHFLRQFPMEIKSEDNLILSHGRNWKNYDVIYYHIPIGVLLSSLGYALGQTFKAFRRASREVRFNTTILEIPVLAFLMTSLYEIVIIESRKRSLVSLLENHLKPNAKLITNRSFGSDVLTINATAKLLNRIHINYQSVAMSMMDYPIKKLADVYYMYSRTAYEYYSSVDNSYRYYIVTFELPKRVRHLDIFVVTVFLQPDEYEGLYLELIKCLLRDWKCVKNRILVIKPHYRQPSLTKWYQMVSGLKDVYIEERSASIDGVLSYTDLAISISSGVLYNCFEFGVPAIAYDYNSRYSRFISQNCLPEVNYVISSYDELLRNIIDCSYILNSYEERRKSYLRLFKYEK